MSAKPSFPASRPVAVFLDLDDTLADETRHLRAANSKALAEQSARIPPATAVKVLNEYLRIALDLSRRNAWDQMSRAKRLTAALQSAGIDDPDLAQVLAEGYEQHYLEGVALLPGAGRLLRAAAAYRTCLVTNGHADEQRGKIRLLGLEHRFDHLLVSEEVGSAKPHPAIFQHALDLVGAKPHQAVMVGDSLHADIGGAAALGIGTIWINPHGWSADGAPAQPDAIVAGAAEAAELLEKLA